MSDNGWIVFLILAVLVGGVNLLMYGIVRGAFRPQNKTGLDIVQKTLNVAQKQNEPIHELRRKMEELGKEKKE